MTEKILVAVRRNSMVNSQEAADKTVFKNEKRNEYLKSWTKKKVYEFLREITEYIDKNKT